MSTKPPALPPSPQEIHRKLSVHAKPVKKPMSQQGALSGTESDSDSQPIEGSSSLLQGSGGAASLASGSQQRLQSIAERRSVSGDETDEDEDDEGAWRVAEKLKEQGKDEESSVKAGYLWKKGSRRKTWKKRWFVLRSPHLAYYKTSAEYQLLRLLDLNEVHCVTPVTLKRHENTFGLVLPARTYYLQADSQEEVLAWVRALNDLRERLQSTASITPVPTPPISMPTGHPKKSAPGPVTPVTPSPPAHAVTSSDEDEGLVTTHPVSAGPTTLLPAKGLGAPVGNDAAKVILSGYLMKCGSKRKSWRKRWFVLTGEKLVYSGSHMDHKHQRQIPLAQLLDAMEYAQPSHRHSSLTHSPSNLPSPPAHAALDELADPHSAQPENHTFKIVTTKRSLMLCAPSEEEEIRWLSAVRALIARRSGGASAGRSVSSAAPEGGGAGHGTIASSGSGTATGSSGFTGKVAGRRRSVSTGGLVAAVEGVVGAGNDKT